MVGKSSVRERSTGDQVRESERGGRTEVVGRESGELKKKEERKKEREKRKEKERK